jgi:hypothetical protein
LLVALLAVIAVFGFMLATSSEIETNVAANEQDVVLFPEAPACAASDPAAAARRAINLEQQLTEEFRAARLRLQSALRDDDLDSALVAITALRKLLEGEDLPYAAYLSETERQIRLKIQRSKKSGKVF